MKELCIMPKMIYQDPTCEIPIDNERFEGSHRHEIFFGADRKKSIKYGLVVFLKPEHHNMSNVGVHFNHAFDLTLKSIGQTVAQEYYHWTKDDFIEKFGRSYI